MHHVNPTSHPLDGAWGIQTPQPATLPTLSPEDSASYPPLLTKPQARKLLGGISERGFEDLRKQQWMPKPIELGPRSIRWSRDELLAALLQRAPRKCEAVEPEHFKAARAKRKGAA